MKHTECEDCKLRNGDCGYHFKMDGKTNYDIPSLTACDRYGNCEFFQKKEKPQGDLISRSALREDLRRFFPSEVLEGIEPKTLFAQIMHDIGNAPTVIPDNDVFEWCTDCKEYDQEKHCCHRWSSKIREVVEEVKQYKLDELRPKGEWKLDSVGVYCSECKLHPDYSSDFCPFCGADMRGEEE